MLINLSFLPWCWWYHCCLSPFLDQDTVPAVLCSDQSGYLTTTRGTRGCINTSVTEQQQQVILSEIFFNTQEEEEPMDEFSSTRPNRALRLHRNFPPPSAKSTEPVLLLWRPSWRKNQARMGTKSVRSARSADQRSTSISDKTELIDHRIHPWFHHGTNSSNLSLADSDISGLL